ncbi:flagellar hook-basal body complex protein FliE [Arboricoccus pini]|uniref:Flagellar hook-basal body complex protein FliE n=1 Tax=Arboricoccus pini TaxID=1963835 RepID=A0A212QV85_9PROT|nr:flagellar hook-basal body complex protein FliE [Arboricoccus pini]SNB63484.1 flagellar hook-basal body complex protein FliE [Arboricoccus pini]
MSIEALNRAVRGYGQTASLLGQQPTAAASQTGQASFADLVSQQVAQTYQSVAGGESATVAAAHGSTDTQAVVEAVAQAELSLHKLTAVRDKVIAAYQDIMRMPI